MKKMKMALLTMAIITAVTGAFAAKKKFDCYNQIQWYMTSPGFYAQTGQFGVHYWCSGSITEVCTYIQTSPGVFVACRTGNYQPITPAP